MNRLLGHCLILLGAGAAAGAASFAIERRGAAGEGAPLVLAHRPAPDGAAADAAPVPQNREALVRLLERELTRVGCYGGAIGGTWGHEAQAAMRAFLARVNARLPVAQPDEILLRLLQGESKRVCGEPCRAAPGSGRDDAACLAAGDAPTPEQSAGRLSPTGAPAAMAEPPAVGVARRADQPAPSDAAAGSRTTYAEGEPPVAGQRTLARHPPKAHARPPKIVRLLIRNLQRFAQFP
jgi:hypothetical protein